jgi:hypothetical protein
VNIRKLFLRQVTVHSDFQETSMNLEVYLGDRAQLSQKDFSATAGFPHMLIQEPRRGFVIMAHKLADRTGYGVRLIGLGMSAPDGVPVDSGDWERDFEVKGDDPLELLEAVQDAMERKP